MRIVLIALLIAAALWRAWADWQGTIAQGYAYKLTTIEQTMTRMWEGPFTSFVQGWQAIRIPFIWDPLGMILMGLPVALLLAVIAGLVWLMGRKPRRA